MDDITNQLAAMGKKADETPKSSPTNATIAFDSDDVFPMLPSSEDPSMMLSPSEPPTRRISNADVSPSYIPQPLTGLPGLRRASTVNRPQLRRMTTNNSSITGATGLTTEDPTLYSDNTRIRLNEDDRRLERFILNNEPVSIPQQSATQISTSPPNELGEVSFQFHCSFGWEGDKAIDLEKTPFNTVAYLAKLTSSKEGIAFVQATINSYQNEINTGRRHNFNNQFLEHQNAACNHTLEQLNEIRSHIDAVIREVETYVGEDEAELKEKLMMAYTHALPWVQRTRRLVSESHIFYKLNYVLGRATVKAATKAKKVRLPTIPAGRAVGHPPLERK